MREARDRQLRGTVPEKTSLRYSFCRIPRPKPGAPLRLEFRADRAATAFAPNDGGTYGAFARGFRHGGPRGRFRSPPGCAPHAFRCRVSAKAHAFRHGVSSKMPRGAPRYRRTLPFRPAFRAGLVGKPYRLRSLREGARARASRHHLDTTTAPAGTVMLHFMGGEAIRLEVECLEALMKDLDEVMPVSLGAGGA